MSLIAADIGIDERLDAARAAFSIFEREMPSERAEGALREALDYVLDLIEDEGANPTDKRIAENLVTRHKRVMLEKLSTDLRGNYGDDRYLQWAPLLEAFQESGFDNDCVLGSARFKLMERVFSSWSARDREKFIRR